MLKLIDSFSMPNKNLWWKEDGRSSNDEVITKFSAHSHGGKATLEGRFRTRRILHFSSQDSKVTVLSMEIGCWIQRTKHLRASRMRSPNLRNHIEPVPNMRESCDLTLSIKRSYCTCELITDCGHSPHKSRHRATWLWAVELGKLKLWWESAHRRTKESNQHRRHEKKYLNRSIVCFIETHTQRRMGMMSGW